MTGDPGPDLATQRAFWNRWNTAHRVPETLPADVLRRGRASLEAISDLDLPSPEILEIGCATGWLCRGLAELGTVTGIDLADEVIARARVLVPEARFLAGDFLAIDFQDESYDVVVSLETIAHVVDRAAFLGRIADVLRPNGHLVLTTQNRSIWERSGWLEKPQEIVQDLLTMLELRRLLHPRFEVVRATTLVPFGDRGMLRLINSRKLNRPFAAVFGAERVLGWKERLGFGNTLFVVARRRV